MSFTLHPRLVNDCQQLGDLSLCATLLMRDHRFPWVILVPRLDGLRDLHDLPRQHAPALFEDIETVSKALIAHFNAQKINVAALGNQVPQLHVHVIGRRHDDVAWPGPVWNAGAVEGVDSPVLERYERTLRQALAL